MENNLDDYISREIGLHCISTMNVSCGLRKNFCQMAIGSLTLIYEQA